MKIVVQRVLSAQVDVEGKRIAEIGQGLLLLVGFSQADSVQILPAAFKKIVNMRLFAEQDKKFHLSAVEVGASLLIVSQFTLYAETSKGRRPEFFGAAAPDHARELFEQALNEARLTGLPVQAGSFGAHMAVSLLNDGPATFVLEF